MRTYFHKNFVLRLLLTCAVFAALSIGQHVNGQFTKANLYIDGLTCSLCSKGVEKALKELPFIKNVAMDLNSNVAEIEFRQPAIVDMNQVATKVKDAGFSVRSLEAFYSFNQLLISDGSRFKYHDFEFVFREVQPQLLSGVHPVRLLGKDFMDARTWTKYKSDKTKQRKNTPSKNLFFITL